MNETSADPGIPGVIPVPMDCDHISICRPESKENLIYLGVKRFIREHLKTPLKPIQLEDKVNPSTSKDKKLETLTIDQRSGGVYFGTGAVHINGDVIGGNQEKFGK